MSDEFLPSIIERVPAKLAEAMLKIPEAYADLSLKDLEIQAKPTKIQRAAKLQMQKEFDRALMTDAKVRITNIYRGVCHENTFYKMLTKTDLIAWMVTPEVEDSTSIELLYEKGKGRIEDLLDIDVFNLDGTIDIRKADFLLKLFKVLSDRVHPMITRTENKNLSVKVDANKDSTVDIQKKIEDLRKKLGQ